MNQQEKMKENLLTEIDGYFMNLAYLIDLIKVENHMINSKLINEPAPNYSMIVKCALIDSYMLCFMRLYDKSKQTKTIPNLINKCKKNVQLFRSPKEVSKKLEEFEKELNDDKDITHAIKILRMRRDKYHVHNDKERFGAKIANDESYLPNYCIHFLINFTERVLSYLWSQLSDEKCREGIYNNDLDNLLKQK